MTQIKYPVKKAVIPAAGFGTRLFPATKAVKKELFPIIDQKGQAKPVILALVEEMVEAGIEEIAIVVQPGDRRIFADFFHQTPAYLAKLSQENQAYSKLIQEIGDRITFLTQETQDGFGHSVYCAKDWVNNQPFLLSLGDHVYLSDTDISCTRQILNIYQQIGRSVVGLKVTAAEEIGHCGCAGGIWQDANSFSQGLLSLTELAEKPDLDYAKKHLSIDKIPPNSFLTIFGIYILESQIFDYLAANINQNIRERGEFQLTSCLEQLRQQSGMFGYLVKGRSFDIGRPDAYRQTLIDFRAG